MIRYLVLVLSFCLFQARAFAYDPEQLYYKLRDKVLLVKDYTADVKMKVDITYMRIPALRGKLYFKAPDKLRMERQGGISILPKKNVNLTLRNLIPGGKVTVIDAGMGTITGKAVRIIKVIPEDEQSGIVLTKIWVDETALLAMRTETTTQNEGTVIMDLEYGKYLTYALPDKVKITMDVKEYKLPKGVTMDYAEVAPAPKDAKVKERKGVIEISYLAYVINKGIDDAVFKKEE
jgi:outer membrane lipoprotein-sorting protein